MDLIHRLAVAEQRRHCSLLFFVVIPAELAGAINADHAVVVGTKAAGLARTAALRFHSLFEAGFIHFQTALTAHVCG
ncbi:hypothetical protein D3C75_1173020 [compost metagenome]